MSGSRARSPSSRPIRPRGEKSADELLHRAEHAATRIENGIKLLADPQVLDAFRIANKVMARAARQRFAVIQNKKPAEVEPPRWRPFQLAFLLMNLPGIVNPTRPGPRGRRSAVLPDGRRQDRSLPRAWPRSRSCSGGCKNPGIQSAGLSVLMRYTLRLLTLDQLGRAATLICALELERQQRRRRSWASGRSRSASGSGERRRPTGWDARATTIRKSARAKTIAFQNDDRKPSPIPLEELPVVRNEVQADLVSALANGKLNSDEPTTCGSPASTEIATSAAIVRCRFWRSTSRSIAVCRAS